MAFQMYQILTRTVAWEGAGRVQGGAMDEIGTAREASRPRPTLPGHWPAPPPVREPSG